ncbi:MAG: SIMPL domain-containing protein [Nitrosarchaeum sp.]
MIQFNKKFVLIASISAIIALSSITLTTTVSQSSLQDISEKMISTSGPTTVKISGESTASIPRDGTRLSVNIMTKPTDLNTLEEQRKEQVDKVINSINNALGKENASITTGYTYYNPQWSNNSPDMSSISAHVEIPIKTKIENISTVTKIITEQGFWVNNLQIQKVPKSDVETNLMVTIPSGSSTPGCESNESCFLPYNKVVNVGQTLAWENLDTSAHTVTSGNPSDGPDGLFDSGLFVSGSTFSFLFDTVGEYDYSCLVHPWMTGKITVIEGDSKIDAKPIEYLYQASLTAVIDLPPDNLDKTIPVYQEKLDALNTKLSEYQLEDKNTKQGTVSFNPTYWPSSMSNVFTSQTQLFIDVDYDNLESVLKAIKGSGANFENFALTYSPESLESIRKDLTQKAIENAKEHALEIISPMNLEIKGIKSIEVKSSTIGNQYGNTPVYSHGVMLRTPFYDSNQINEASVIVDVEFEVGK